MSCQLPLRSALRRVKGLRRAVSAGSTDRSCTKMIGMAEISAPSPEAAPEPEAAAEPETEMQPEPQTEEQPAEAEQVPEEVPAE